MSTVVFAYNSSVHSSTRFTPFMLSRGYEATLPADLDRPVPTVTNQDHAEWLRQLQASLQAAHTAARAN